MNTTDRLLLTCATLGFVFGIGCANVQAPPNAGNGSGGNHGSGGKNGTSGSGGGGVVLPDAGKLEAPIMPGNCGNGNLDPGEECDDGNTNDGDGCTRLCQIEAGYTCPNVGKSCNPPTCGDGVLAASETCDDGNTNDGDGCSSDCKTIDPHFQCRVPGKRCVPICGDGFVVQGIETCDDGNTNDGDGCSSTCLIEPGSSCMNYDNMPSVCTKSVCGNGVVEAGESCDDGPNNGVFLGDGKGCTKLCTTEPNCRDSSGKNQACKAVCGDGNVDMSSGSTEQCDDGNQADGDGCSHDCQLEQGWSCSTMAKPDMSPCTQAGNSGNCLELPVVFRDFKSEHETGGHPDFMYHSTSRPCIPNSSGPAHCGDAEARCWGIVQDNLLNGKPQLNGSPTCKCQFTDWSVKNDGNHVPGYTMTNSPLNGLTGLTSNQGAPVYTTTVPAVKSATTFNQWFNDSTASSPANMHIVSTLELASTGNSYRFSSSPDSIQGGFFPLDQSPAPTGMGMTAAGEPLLCNLWPYWYSSTQFGAGAGCKADQYLFPPSIPATYLAMDACSTTGGNPGCITGTWVTGVQGKWHDQWFTDEVHYYFVLTDDGLTLQFYGDDDMYIFINGVLVVDLGGIHQRLPGKVVVDNTGMASITEGGFIDSGGNITSCPSNDPADAKLQVCGVKAVTGDDCRTRTANLNLSVGSTYEIAIFGADRGATESNYQLTLNGFSTNETVCTPRCGDGAVSGGEECDCGDGTGTLPAGCSGPNDDSTYGGCTTQCKFGPYCGDGNTDSDAGEKCDDGTSNGATYITDTSNPGCSVTCQLPHYCGDGKTDTAYGEQCDLGASNGQKVTDGDKQCVVCDTKCQLVTEC